MTDTTSESVKKELCQKLKDLGRLFRWKGRGDTWYFDRKPERGRYNTGKTDFTEAFLVVMEWNISGRWPDSRNKKLSKEPFADYCVRYWAENLEAKNITKIYIKAMTRCAELFVRPYFKKRELGAVTDSHVLDFLDCLKTTETERYKKAAKDGKPLPESRYISPSTRRTIRNSICPPLQFAQRKGWNAEKCDWIAVCRTRRSGRENGYFSGMVRPRDIFLKDELEKLDNAEWDDKRAAVIYAIARQTGMRYGEIRGLKVGKVRKNAQDGAYIEVDTAYNDVDREKCTKTGRARMVPLSDALYFRIQSYVAAELKPCSPESWLFPKTSDAGQPVNESFMKDKLNKMMARLGIPKYRMVKGVRCVRTFHSLRHVHDMELADAGLTVREISDMQGHGTDMVKHYTDHYSDEQYRTARAKIQKAGLLGGGAEGREIEMNDKCIDL